MREPALGGTMKLRLFYLLLSLLLLPTSDADAQQVKLKANLQFPISNPVFGGSLARFKQEVEQQSENAVAVEIFDKAQLFADYQVIDAVSSGAVDIAMTAAQQFSYKAPVVGVIDQPFLFNFHALMSAAGRPGSEIRKLIDEAILAEVGVRVLWWHALGNNVVLSKGRDVADPERMKQQRVGSPGKIPGEFVATCGGTPAVMTIERFRDAYKDGALDMSVAGFGAIAAYNLVEFVDTVTFTDHTPITFLLVINEKRWQALAPDHRAVIERAASKVEIEISGFLTASESRARAFAEKHNVKLQALTPDQVADWRACSAGMLADYMSRVGDSARKIMDAYGRLRLDPCCSAAPGDAPFTRR
jgi:TRAP-type C4-dicarboxylate transport system substrate-binding protein